MNEIEVLCFLSRLKSLQNICYCNSADTNNLPQALLFICGCDSKNNSLSYNLLKYLFFHGVGNFLLDGALEESFDLLEELVFLIEYNKIVIFYNADSKSFLVPFLSKVHSLFEYISEVNIQNEIDQYQTDKCVQFKKMILEHLSSGVKVGMSISNGSDNNEDVESWPLIQSFALDSVVCPTGFFSAKYNIVDITSSITKLFKTIDEVVLSNILEILKSSVLPHIDQLIDILDTVTLDQRIRLSADTICGPLDMLYDFGILDCIGCADNSSFTELKPFVLIGSDSVYIRNIDEINNINWRNKCIDKYNLHVVFEGCEPSAGIRFCRTYFLHRGILGQHIPTVTDLTNDEGSIEISNPVITLLNQKELPKEIISMILILQNIYYKLCYGLRAVVRYAFSKYRDIFEAGKFIQDTLDLYIRGEKTNIFNLNTNFDDIKLQKNEFLSLHFDCMDSFGNIITVDEVEEIGGSCLTYIRASVHNIAIIPKGYVTVAVGDTFLFSSNNNAINDNLNNDHFAELIESDYCCITHLISYNKWFVGYGPEDKSNQHILQSIRNPYIQPLLNIGKSVTDKIFSETFVLVNFTDNPLLPYAISTIHPFSEGFVIESSDNMSSTVIINFNYHLSKVWIIDTNDLIKSIDIDIFNDDNVKDGLLVIFEIHHLSIENHDDNTGFEGLIKKCLLEKNPLDYLLPLMNKLNNKYIALYSNNNTFGSNSNKKLCKLSNSSKQTLSKLCSIWRPVFSLLNVPIYRSYERNIPQAIVNSLLHYNNSLSIYSDKLSSIEISDILRCYYSNRKIYGCGNLMMQCAYHVMEMNRLSNSKVDTQPLGHYQHMIISGVTTSGIVNISNVIISRLSKALVEINVNIVPIILDLSDIKDSQLKTTIYSYLNDKISNISYNNNTIIIIVLINSVLSKLSNIFKTNYITEILGGEVLSLMSVVNYYPITKNHNCFGSESWEAMALYSLVKQGACEFVVVVSNHNHSQIIEKIITYIRSYNTYATVIKFSGDTFVLSEDDCNDLVEVIKTQMFERKSNSRINDLVTTRGCKKLYKLNDVDNRDIQNVLQSVGHSFIKPENSLLGWNIKSLVKVLQFLFPNAYLSCHIEDPSIYPYNISVGVWPRLIQLATVKVMSKHYNNIIENDLINNLSNNKSNCYNIFGVAGFVDVNPLYVHSENLQISFDKKDIYYIEANPGLIVINKINTVLSSFKDIEINQLKILSNSTLVDTYLFKLCDNKLIYPKLHLSSKELSADKIKQIHNNYVDSESRNNRNNFLFDGHSYVDFYGNRKELRPDVNTIVDEYVCCKNYSIDKYNKLLKLIN